MNPLVPSAARQPRGRVLWFCDTFGCRDDATGAAITPLAVALADRRPAEAWTVRGTAGPCGNLGVHRLPATRFSRTATALLGWNFLTTGLAYLAAPLWVGRPGDVAVVVTSPRLGPLGPVWACARRRIPTVVVVHDVYPDVLAAVGWLRPESLGYRLYRRWFDAGLRRTARVVVLGEDMRRRLAARLPELAGRWRTIPNWADTAAIRPMPAVESRLRQRLGLGDRFVVQFSGTLGRTHDAAVLLDAAERLRGDDRIRFLVLASGVQAGAFARQARAAGLGNVLCQPPVARVDLGDALAAGDLGVIAFKEGMTGVSVPSRIYNGFAAGRPLLLAAGADSDAAVLVRERDIGWVVPPGDGNALAEQVHAAAANPAAVQAKGQRARRAVEEQFSVEHAVERYRQVLDEVAPAT